MGLLFKSDFHDEFGSWPLAYIPYGGADFGEVLAVANAVGDGDDSAFYAAWVAAGDRLAEEAASALRQGRRLTARASFLRASCFYGTSYHPFYGKPVDARLVAAFRKQTDALRQGLSLCEPAVKPLRIPFEGSTLPGYLIPAVGHAQDVRPLIIHTNGYDASLTDLYFASAVAASRRGYHCLIFDGPGQGEALIERGLTFRPDWEIVVKAVVDAALELPTVNPKRMALSGWSLGGYLAARAASEDPRLAACICDPGPGPGSIAEAFRGFAMMFGATAEAAANLGELEEPLLDKLWEAIQSDRRLRWSVVQRGFWVNGVDNLRAYLASCETFSLEGRAERIRCPTLLTSAQNDRLSAGAEALYAVLRCPKQLMHFTAAEGAGDHCEMMNRSLLNQRVLDWLDTVWEPNAG